MQIVRDLAGYSYGRSDLVRRAMSKKKVSVMEKERRNFVYGNEEEGVKGCIVKGISEKVANHIYDEMIDFAKYAFNKSHAACYAIVSYQTAYLKYYYPLEFMAALMTSVLDNVNKVSEYILTCRQMGIEILPPDINEGDGNFSVSGNKIRYGLSAIKGLGKPVIDAMVTEREKNGFYKSIKDIASRLSNKEINKRTIENLIKSGALDSMAGTRQEKMLIYAQILDNISQDRKKNIVGQMSLFELEGVKEEAIDLEISLPKKGEYEKEQLLAYEKEVLGIYVSGHPLEEYEKLWKANITKNTLDFVYNEEEKRTNVLDGAIEIIGGIITSKTVKTTKNNAMMAFITIEDIVGVVEVIIFPRDYERYKAYLIEENKVFVKGKVTVEEDKPAKLICQELIPFEQVPRELWVKFPDKDSFIKNEQHLYDVLSQYDGNDQVCIFCESEKVIKRLPKSRTIKVEKTLLQKLSTLFSEENVKVVEKSIEKS